MELRSKKVMVTGGTGFIGGRLIEKLILEEEANVKALVRNFSHASRIARFPLEMIGGDITDENAVLKAAEGCDVIFHCAYDFAGNAKHKEEVSVKGTENVCKAALRYGVKRLVHVSTFSVYGSTPDGDLDENSPKQPSEDIYTKTKLLAEELVLDYHKRHGLPVAVIQPTIVYGPFSRAWTINPVKQMLSEQVVLVNDGNGFCNAVYIDDVVDAMFLAVIKDESVGEVFLVSGSEPVTWKTFYGSLEKAIGRTATISMTDKEIEDLQRSSGMAIKSNPETKGLLSILRDPYVSEQIYQIPAIQNFAETINNKFPRLYSFIVSKALGRTTAEASTMREKTKSVKNIQARIPDKTRYDLLRSKTRVRIDKARNLLGYDPKYDFEKGMSLTNEFLKWANLIRYIEK